MIALALILLVIGIFVWRNVMWPVGATLLIVGVVFYIVTAGQYVVY